MLHVLRSNRWNYSLQFARCFLEKFGSNTAGLPRGYRQRNKRDATDYEADSLINHVSDQKDGFFEETEEDWDLNALKQVDDHKENNMKITKSALKKNIIKRKYFKTPISPNLVTWAEKEYLKYLHKSEPQTWSVAALAENFGITTDAVKKIIRSNWRPESEKRITKHDSAVARRRQILGLPTGTGTSSSSSIALIPVASTEIDQPALASGQFSSLVCRNSNLNSVKDNQPSRQAKRNDPDTPTTSPASQRKEPVSSGQNQEKDNFLIAPVDGRRRFTLSKYMQTLEKSVSKSKSKSEVDPEICNEPGVLSDTFTLKVWKDKQEARKQYAQHRKDGNVNESGVDNTNAEVTSETQDLWNEFFQRGRICKERVYKDLSGKPIK